MSVLVSEKQNNIEGYTITIRKWHSGRPDYQYVVTGLDDWGVITPARCAFRYKAEAQEAAVALESNMKRRAELIVKIRNMVKELFPTWCETNPNKTIRDFLMSEEFNKAYRDITGCGYPWLPAQEDTRVLFDNMEPDLFGSNNEADDSIRFYRIHPDIGG